MRRSRLLAAVALIPLATGCETLGSQRRVPVTTMVAGEYEPQAPSGARGQAQSSRLPGALSSEAGDIEGHLLHRSADPDFH